MKKGFRNLLVTGAIALPAVLAARHVVYNLAYNAAVQETVDTRAEDTLEALRKILADDRVTQETIDSQSKEVREALRKVLVELWRAASDEEVGGLEQPGLREAIHEWHNNVLGGPEDERDRKRIYDLLRKKISSEARAHVFKAVPAARAATIKESRNIKNEVEKNPKSDHTGNLGALKRLKVEKQLLERIAGKLDVEK